MRTEARSVLDLVIAMLVQLLLQKILWNEPWMKQTIHSFLYFHIQKDIVGDFVTEIIFINHILQKICNFEADVIISCRWSVEL